MPDLLIASHNPWKFKLFAPVFQEYGFQPVFLGEIASAHGGPPENGATVLENALQKVRFNRSAEFPWIFADDTGLEIDALNGEPGVEFRRWGGRFTESGQDQEWLDYLLERMRTVPPKDRTAWIVSGWALIDPQGCELTREFRVNFEIATTQVRAPMPGSPVMAVALGLPLGAREIIQQAKTRLDAWGPFNKLLQENPQ